MDNVVGQIMTVFLAITGVAIVAVLVSKNAQTPAVISSFGNAVTSGISAAVGPVMGGNQFG